MCIKNWLVHGNLRSLVCSLFSGQIDNPSSFARPTTRQSIGIWLRCSMGMHLKSGGHDSPPNTAVHHSRSLVKIQTSILWVCGRGTSKMVDFPVGFPSPPNLSGAQNLEIPLKQTRMVHGGLSISHSLPIEPASKPASKGHFEWR